MELNSEQTQKISDMLGEPKVKWSRYGAYFCSKRTPEMDGLVDAGALRVEETIESWGPCVTYIVTDGMRNRMAAVMLSSNAELRGRLRTVPLERLVRQLCPERKDMKSQHDAVNHPKHYTSHPSGVECIQVTEHMGFNLGNAVKYIWRADLKADAIEDLKKAKWYIERELMRRELPNVLGNRLAAGGAAKEGETE